MEIDINDFNRWCFAHNNELEELFYEEGASYIDTDWEQYAFDKDLHELAA